MKGIIASPGIAIGKAFVLEQKEVVINEALLKDASECEAEVEKFRKAVTETEAQLNDIIETTEKRLSAKEADVFRAHLMMLNDPTLEDAVMDKINNGMMHADKAVAEATEEVSPCWLLWMMNTCVNAQPTSKTWAAAFWTMWWATCVYPWISWMKKWLCLPTT